MCQELQCVILLHRLCHPFHEHLPNMYYVPSTMLLDRDTQIKNSYYPKETDSIFLSEQTEK